MPRPRWGVLYGIVVIAIPAVAVLHVWASPPALRIGLELALVAVTFAAMRSWARANRSALDLRDWCGCASASVSIRVIASAAPRRREEPPGEALREIWVVDRATRDDVAALPARRG